MKNGKRPISSGLVSIESTRFGSQRLEEDPDSRAPPSPLPVGRIRAGVVRRRRGDASGDARAISPAPWQNRQRAPFRVRIEGLDLGAARHERLEQRVAAAPDLREQVGQDVGRALAAKFHPQIDERQQDARPFAGERQLP